MLDVTTSDRPPFDETKAEQAIGKLALVGITLLSSGGQVVERQQFSGTIVAADASDGIQLALDGGGDYWLPPDTRALVEGSARDYRLNDGRVVTNPDYLMTWIVRARGRAASPSRRVPRARLSQRGRCGQAL